jgi:hypothetical protein
VLLELAAKHSQFKAFVASSLDSLGLLDFVSALQNAHSARKLAAQMADDSSRGAPFTIDVSALSPLLFGATAHRFVVFGSSKAGGIKDVLCESIGRNARSRSSNQGFDWVLAASMLVPLFGAVALYLSRSTVRKIKIT